MNISKFIFLLFLLSTSLFSAWENIDGGRGNFTTDSDFHLLYGGTGNTVSGDFSATGNSILISNNPTNASLIYDTTTFKTVDAAFNANAYSLGDSEKMNSSSAQITLPPYVQGSDIVWAGLFWQGHVYRKTGAYTDAAVDANAANWNKVTIKDSNGAMHQIEAPIGNDDTTHKAFHHTITNGTGYRHHYGAYHDVTSILQNSYSSVQNTFTVGNIKTTAGQDTGGYVYITQAPTYSGSFQFGLYGGWSMIVVYNVDGTTAVANSVPLKNVSIYDGYDLYLTWGPDGTAFETTIDISGFYTPKSGVLNSKLLLFGGAGDRAIGDDTLQIQNQKNIGTYVDLSNTPNPAGEQFNHSYTIFGTHMTPSDTNKQGMDLDIYDVSSQMTNEQTQTKIKFGVVKDDNHCDQIFPQVLAFSTQLYEPQFCYDYAYKQQGIYFTEDNNGTEDPKITVNKLPGGAIVGEPVEVSIFLRNLVDSDIQITDMSINVLDINTTQATYERETTKLAKIGQLVPSTIADSTIVVDDEYIKNVQIGSMDSNDNFFLYYSLDPKKSDLNMPITVRADYNLVVNAETIIPYTLNIGANVPMCSAGNFNYSPAKGIFNVVHNDYYDLDSGGSNQFYNLPTQVTSREGNFKVLSFDVNNTDTLQPSSTMVAVEMIDASAFHDTNASCQEAASSITEKVWVIFDGNVTSAMFNQSAIQNSIALNMTQINNSSDFYKNARQNAAFRVSYNVDNDTDELFIVSTGKKAGTYDINFPDLTKIYGNECAGGRLVVYDKDKGKTTNQIPVACANNSDITPEELQACMECIYGYNTKMVCSRDNFSIRPEAFLMQIDDQNQTNSISQMDITTVSNSGSAGASAPSPQINLAAGYNYNIEVNATNHLNNTSSAGYTKTFNITSEDSARYIWEPKTITIANANLFCNDRNDSNISVRLVNGKADTNTSLNQVGEYRLNILDTTWTTVDSNATFMSHHANSFFFPGDGTIGLDCNPGSSNTHAVNSVITANSTTLNGCNISSQHNGSSTSNMQYNDYNVTFHPYKFDVATNVTLGEAFITPPLNNAFIYMADIDQDENMSVQLNTFITARGRSSATGLSNFVTGCYAKPLDINISKSNTISTQLEYKYRFNDYNTSAAKILSTAEINATIPAGINRDVNITTTDGYFLKSMNGALDTTTRLNFNREVNETANPERVTFETYNVEDSNNRFTADLNISNMAEGYSDINKSTTQRLDVTHFYGRTAGKTTRVICDTLDTNNTCASGNDEDDVFIYYEVFCNGTLNGNTCTPALLPTDVNGNPVQKVDSRWFINLDHNRTAYGAFTATVDSINPGFVGLPNGITHSNNYTLDSVHTYNETLGLPYTANMNDTVPRWLIYDPSNAAATVNTHTVIFRPRTEWSGEHETNTTTKTERIKRVNRRTMW